MSWSGAAFVILCAACGAPYIRMPAQADRSIPSADGPERVRIRRLLVAYQGAEGASELITRSREDAEERAEMLSGMAREGSQSFQELVSAYGDAPPERDDRSLEPDCTSSYGHSTLLH